MMEPTCPAGVCGEVMRVSGLQALLHLLQEILDLTLDFPLESCAHLRRKEDSHESAGEQTQVLRRMNTGFPDKAQSKQESVAITLHSLHLFLWILSLSGIQQDF